MVVRSREANEAWAQPRCYPNAGDVHHAGRPRWPDQTRLRLSSKRGIFGREGAHKAFERQEKWALFYALKTHDCDPPSFVLSDNPTLITGNMPLGDELRPY